MRDISQKNKEYLRDNQFINGFYSEGNKITVYFNNKHKVVLDFDDELKKEKKELELLKTMESQMKTAVDKMGAIQYSAFEEQTIAATGLTLGASLALFGDIIGGGTFFFPASLLSLTAFATEYGNYLKDETTLRSIDKYTLYLENKELLDKYAEEQFASVGSPEGYTPAYITSNDVDGYSVQELQELINGIKSDNEQSKLVLD